MPEENSSFKVAVSCSCDPESYSGFCYTHWCSLGSIEINSTAYHLVRERARKSILPDFPIAIHDVKVKLQRVHNEVVVDVLWIGQRFQ